MKSTLSLVVLATSLLINKPSFSEEGNWGVSIGSPSLFNAVYKGDWLHLSGGYWGETVRGIEAAIPVYQFKGEYLDTLNVTVGHSRIEDDKDDVDEWNYIGLSTTIYFDSFYVEPGINIGKGDYDSPQLAIQLGYLL